MFEIPKLIVVPVIAVAITQLLKFIIKGAAGEWRWSVLSEYGGMPSAHTAFVTSLSTVVLIAEGIDSVAFAICFVFSIIIIRDAIGFRQFLGQHGKILNMLVKKLPKKEEDKYSRGLVEQLGHTPFQALIGGLLGIFIGILLYNCLPTYWVT
jgi:uncharacterized protein